MSSSPQKWSGPLKSKRKADLQEICRALGIQFRPDTIKLELEQDIVDAFKADPALQADPRFEEVTYLHQPSTPPESGSGSAFTRPATRRGPFASQSARSTSSSARRGVRQGEDTDEDGDGEESEEQRVPKSRVPENLDSIPPSRRSPRRKSLIRRISEQVDRLPSSVELAKAVGTAERGVEKAISQASLKIDSSKPIIFLKQTSSQVAHKLGDASLGLADLTLSGCQATQYALSSPWAVWALQIAAELAYVFCSLVPLDYKHLPQAEDFVRLPNSAYAAIQLINSERFLRPLLDYTAFTILIPLTMASLINFAPAPLAPTKTGLLDRLTMLKPSPLTFAATRLAALVLIHYLFQPSNRFGWSSFSFKDNEAFLNPGHLPGGWSCKNPELVGLEIVQAVTCSLGLTLGLHQLLSQAAHNP